MVEMSIDRGDLLVEVQGWSKLWALKRRFRVPLAHIKAVRWDPAVGKGWWKGWRAPGTHIPGVIAAGTFYRGGRREFWDIRTGRKAVTIELEGDSYRRLVVDVADPRATVAMINEALGRPSLS